MRDLAILERRTGAGSDRQDDKGEDRQAEAQHDPHQDGLGATEFVSAAEPDADESLFVLDLPHPNRQARNRFGRGMPITVDALAWLPAGAALPDSWSETFVERFRLSVRPHVAWCPAPGDSADAVDVVKQVSFLHASSGTDQETFRDHYRHHVELARRHMPALWQYVQNDVEAAHGGAPEAVGVMAVSELWFRTTDDFLNRYFPSEADQREFSAQEGFLDLTQATSFICSSHVFTNQPLDPPGNDR